MAHTINTIKNISNDSAGIYQHRDMQEINVGSLCHSLTFGELTQIIPLYCDYLASIDGKLSRFFHEIVECLMLLEIWGGS